MGLDYEIQDDDKQFELLLQSKWNKELVKAIGNLITAFNRNNQNKDIQKAIGDNSKAMSVFAKYLSELEINVAAPNVNVQTNQESVVAEVKLLKEQGGRIENLLSDQNNILKELFQQKEWEHKVVYKTGLGSGIDKIVSTPKIINNGSNIRF